MAALFALVSCVAAPLGLAAPVQASTPPVAWQNLKALHVLCVVAGGRAGEREALEQALCRQAARLAADGAPVSVSALAPGDPALLDPTRATLLIQGQTQEIGGLRLLTVNIRPYRNGGTDHQILFGAPPLAVLLDEANLSGAALDAALAPALAQTLPWLATTAGPRPLK